MRIQIIQHSAADSAAAAGRILDDLGHRLSTVRMDQGQPIPSRVDCDALITFGGAVSLASDNLPPWVSQERRLIRSYLEKDRRVLGICLGAQLLASAVGARVRRNSQPEVGWHELVRVEDDTQKPVERNGTAAALPQRMMAFMWHQDTFEMPAEATRLYESRACANQAFTIDGRSFGFQFHFEANQRTVRTFLAVSKLCRRPGRFVQTEQEILDGTEKYLNQQHTHLVRFLGEFCPA